MRPSANLHLHNQQQPSQQQISCPTQGCTDTYASASTLTLHIHQGNHHFGPAQGHEHEHIHPHSPTAPNPQADLRELSSSPPVHLDASLFNAPEEVVNPDVTFQQYLLSALSSDSSPHQPSRSPSAPLHPSPDADISQGSPMNIDGDLPSALKVHPLSLHLLVEATPMTLMSRYHHYWAAYLQSVLLFMMTAPVTLPLMITLLLSSKSEW